MIGTLGPGLDSPSSARVWVRSCEGDVFESLYGAVCMSVVLAGMCEDQGPMDELPVPGVKTSALGKLLEYCQHHQGEQGFHFATGCRRCISEPISVWDAAYMRGFSAEER